MAFKRKSASRKTLFLLTLPLLLLLMTIAYSFNWDANSNNDLARYIIDFRGIKAYGLDYKFQYADQFSLLYRVVAFVFCHLNNYHLYPVITILVEYGIYMYILLNISEEYNFTGLEILISFMLKFALLPPIMSITASRNAVAYAFFSLGIYFYYKYGLKNFRVYLWMIMGLLFHTSVVVGVVFFGLFLLVKKHEKIILLLPLWGLLVSALMIGLGKINTSYTKYLNFKWNYYILHPTQFDIVKSNMIIIWLVILTLCCLYCYFTSSDSYKRNRSFFVIILLTATVGSYTVLPELFLRLCYPISMLFPLMMAEFYLPDTCKKKNKALTELLLLGITCVAFLRTGAGWFYQIYWFGS